MSVSSDLEKSIEDIARALEDQVREPDGIIIEANIKLATLNLCTEAWVDSGIGRTMLGYAQVFDHESPSKAKWELVFDIENLGRSIESLLTAPRVVQMAAIERLPYLLKACGERPESDREAASPSACLLGTPRERLGCESSQLEGRDHNNRGDVGKRRGPGTYVSGAGSGHQR